jgi:flagellar hook protein FlgE
MLGSLYSGISGLKANGEIMSILGNNIANVSTVGFKKSSGTFFDILSTSLSGGGSSMQVGRGTYMGSVKTEFLQGDFERTESVTDLAIEGDGFFVVKDPNPNEDNLYYTRNGQFIIDKDGYLVTTDGLRVQGYMLNETSGAIDYTDETDIQISNAMAASRITQSAELGLNLDADTDTGADGAYSTTLTVYDSQGREVPLTFTFERTNTNTWEVTPSLASGDQEFASGNTTAELVFDSDGQLTTIDGNGAPFSLDVNLDLSGTGADTPQAITVDFTDITQYASASTTKKLVQDGFAAGELRNVEFSSDGYITGHYTNGLSQEIGRIFLGNFRNPNGLSKVGDTRFVATRESGQAIHNTPGTGLATIDSNSLEAANVDMAAEFVRLISAQRAFSANAKVVSTSDQMLADLMSVKR